jgi:hypothetical protein
LGGGLGGNGNLGRHGLAGGEGFDATLALGFWDCRFSSQRKTKDLLFRLIARWYSLALRLVLWAGVA